MRWFSHSCLGLPGSAHRFGRGPPRRRLRRRHPRRHDLRRRAAARLMSATSRSGRPDRRGRAADRRRAARREIDARGLAVAPGFINMLSWATEIADRGRPRPERHPPGRDARGDGRGLVDGAAQRGDEGRCSNAPGRHPLSDQLDEPRRISRACSSGGASRPTSPASSARRRCGSTSSARATSIPTPAQLARMRALVRQAMNEGRDGRRQLADLRARPISPRPTSWSRWSSEAGRCGGIVYQPHARRGRRRPRGDRRADRDRRGLGRAGAKSTISSCPAATIGAGSTR